MRALIRCSVKGCGKEAIVRCKACRPPDEFYCSEHAVSHCQPYLGRQVLTSDRFLFEQLQSANVGKPQPVSSPEKSANAKTPD